eukprot:TRINITY_DN5400_c0_g2_i3.p2 TRINITY_DN5400_c0_g2~~TRINITY_DN5400_c0_g2_i3.p2  ORF type:complete len:162 (+),score=13.92 TRINITY_DN5400_c0_g2_i3:22-486(+)
MVWLVVSIVGMVLCGLIHAAHWCFGGCCACLWLVELFSDDTGGCSNSRTTHKDIELPPTPPPHMDVMKPIAPPVETMSTGMAVPLNPNSNDGYRRRPPTHDTDDPQTAPPPHPAGLEWKNVPPHIRLECENVSPHVEMTPMSAPLSADMMRVGV